MPLSDEFVAQLAKVRENGNFLDFSLICEDKAIPVHRIIISQSPVFYAAISGHFKEKKTRTYGIKDHSSKIVIKMVDFLYSGSYKADSSDTDDVSSFSDKARELVCHVRIYMLADEFLLPDLRALAKTEFDTLAGTITDVSHLLEAVLLVFGLPGASAAPLKAALAAALKELMKKSKYSAKYETLVDRITFETPDFFTDFFRSVWADDFPAQGRCTCGSLKGGRLW